MRVNNELEGYGRRQLWPNLRYYHRISFERLRKTMENLSQDSWCPGQDFHIDTSQIQVTVVTTRANLIGAFSITKYSSPVISLMKYR
jgi:hypothetical protein